MKPQGQDRVPHEVRALFIALCHTDPRLASTEWGNAWQAAAGRPNPSRHPVGHLLRTLRYPAIIAHLTESEAVAGLTVTLLRGLQHLTRRANPAVREHLSLAGRRLIFAALACDYHADPRHTVAAAIRDRLLPPAALATRRARELADVAWVPRSAATIAEFARWSRRLIGEMPLPEHPRPARRTSRPGLDHQAAAVAAATSGYRLRPDALSAALQWLSHAHKRGWHSERPIVHATALSVTSEILTGLPFEALLTTRTDGESVARISADALTLSVGQGWQPGDSCLHAMDIYLPWPAWLNPSANVMTACFPLGKLPPRRAAEMRGCRDQLLAPVLRLPNSRPQHRRHTVPLHMAFPTLAVLHLGIPPAISSYMLGRPMPGMRGEVDYLSLARGELEAAFVRVWRRFHELSGLALPDDWAPRIRLLHPEPTPPLQVCADFADRLRDLDTWNEAMAAVTGFLRLHLGLRPSIRHPDPRALVRHHPLPSIEISDKLVAGETRTRWLPLLAPVHEIIVALHDAPAVEGELPYCSRGQICRFRDLDHDEQQRLSSIWLHGSAKTNLRSVFYNLLRGETSLHRNLTAAMGHGPAPWQWNGAANPVSLEHSLRTLTPALVSLYTRAGSHEMSRTLKAALNSLAPSCPRPKVATSPRPPAVPEHAAGPSHLAFAPLSPAEHDLHDRLRKALLAAKHEKRLLADFVIAAALEAGLPPANLIWARHYYDYSIMASKETKAALFALVACGDAGGLALLPLPLSPLTGPRSTAWTLLTKLHDRSRISGLKTLLFANPADGIRRVVGARVARLLFPYQTRPALSPADGWALLDRIAVNIACWAHGGFLASALTRRVEIKCANVGEVLARLQMKPPLACVDGSTYLPPAPKKDIHAAGRFRQLLGVGARSPGRPRRLPSGLPSSNPVNWRVRDWARVFSVTHHAPYKKGIEYCLKRLPGLRTRAARLAERIQHDLHRDGYARVARACPISLDGTPFEDILFKPDSCEDSADVRAFIAFLRTTVCRAGEAMKLRPGHVLVVLPEEGHDAFLSVHRGKTAAAKRTLSVASMSPDRRLVDPVVEDLVLRLRRDIPPLASIWWPSDELRLRRRAESLLLAAGLRLHDLRHIGACERLVHSVGVPNTYHVWATEAGMLGHSGPVQSLALYIGTAAGALLCKT